MTHTIKARYIEGTGEFEKGQYGNGTLALTFVMPPPADEPWEGPDHIVVSVNLVESHRLVPPSDCIFVKQYSGHEGMPEALADAGVAEFVDGPSVGINAYDATVVLMRVLI